MVEQFWLGAGKDPGASTFAQVRVEYRRGRAGGGLGTDAVAGRGVQNLGGGAGASGGALARTSVCVPEGCRAFPIRRAGTLAFDGVPGLRSGAGLDFGASVADLLEVGDALAGPGVVAFGAKASRVIVAPTGAVSLLRVVAVGACDQGFTDQS